MPIDPTARVLIDAMERNFPSFDPDVSGTVLRERVEAAAARVMPGGAEPESVGSVLDRTIPGPAGDIPIRIYRPNGPPGAIATFFHGGGFVLCDLESHDGICRAICNAASAVVVAVHYRRAPESRYPAAVEDCYAATVWAAEHAAELDADPATLAVIGDSAGGNLAAAVALMARDRNGPPLAGQVLVYPMLDRRADTRSHRETGDAYYLKHEEVMYFWGEYLGEHAGREGYASPSLAAAFTGLPPALIATAEFDPLRDEGEAYADSLAAAGVSAIKHRYDGMFHSFFSFMGVLPAADQLRDEIAAFLRSSPHSDG